ncbi:hypothetical protein M011DRAFT_386093, partial [Sporormia fimetaria CBS 119925]
MPKRERDLAGDVLRNRFNIGFAKREKLLGSLMGLDAEAEPRDEDQAEKLGDDEDDLAAVGYEHVGLGAKVPKHVLDGNGKLPRRTPGANDQLLRQLLGNKGAKAHIAARKESILAKGRAPEPRKPFRAPKPAESEDEDEGRAATFKSKRRKTTKSVKRVEDDDVSEGQTTLAEKITVAESELEEPPNDTEKASKDAGNETDDAEPVQETRAKPKSFLDEVLAERSTRKKKK